nr:reverse transcriptase domain-containing protein [Tanacetum cinerariifolium]
MPLSIWKKLSLPELTPTKMILELVDRSTTRPAGIAEEVFVKVGKFHFPTDFVVVDYVVDPRVPLILGRPFLRTGRALIDVYGEELTLRVDDEAITFKVGKNSKYSYNDAESINRINVIDVACEEYVQEVLEFLKISKSGNPTPTSDPIIASSSPSFPPFKGSDFILEEIKTFLQTSDGLSNLDDDYYDMEGDIIYLEKLLNEDPSSNLPPMKNEDLKQVDATMTKPSIEEPPELELKDLPSYLEYAFLEGSDKLPVIISKELKDKEKFSLLKVLKSDKRAMRGKSLTLRAWDHQAVIPFTSLLTSCVRWQALEGREVLMIDWLGIVETDKVNHIIETDIVKLVVEIESFGMSFDDFDKEVGSSDGLQPRQADLSCVHALSELHLHEIHVVPSKHEADQY